jgi:putative ABC transport system ATP-binding protein
MNVVHASSALQPPQSFPSNARCSADTAGVATHSVTHTFQTGNQSYCVLKGIDLEVPIGSLQLLMGPSGAGKTTLLSILAGLLTPEAGQISLLGQDTRQFSKAQLAQFRLENIGFIFQEFHLFGALTALENVEMALQHKGFTSNAARKEAIALLQQVGLGHRTDQLPRKLSGGEKQRVAVARALAGNPPIVLADEPTASLDSRNGRQVMELLQKMTRDRHCTVLMATHDHRVVDFADRIMHLEDGKLKV